MDPQSFPYNVDMDQFQRSDDQENSVHDEEQTTSSGLGKTIGNLTGFMSSFTHGRASQAHEAPGSLARGSRASMVGGRGGTQEKTLTELGNEKAVDEAAKETEDMAERILIQTTVPDADLEEGDGAIGDDDGSGDDDANGAEDVIDTIAREALDGADEASSGDEKDIPTASSKKGRRASGKVSATTTPKGRRGRPAAKPVSARQLQAAERKAVADAKARQEKRAEKAAGQVNGTAKSPAKRKTRGPAKKAASEEQLDQVAGAKKVPATPVRRGRPPQAAPSSAAVADGTPKRRGRPPKNASAAQSAGPKSKSKTKQPKSTTTVEKTAGAPKRIGRPPKNAVDTPAPAAGKKRGAPSSSAGPAAKKPRISAAGKRIGRPPKAAAAATVGDGPKPRGRPPLHKKRGRPALYKTTRVFAPAVPPEPTKVTKRNTANSSGKVLRTR